MSYTQLKEDGYNQLSSENQGFIQVDIQREGNEWRIVGKTHKHMERYTDKRYKKELLVPLDENWKGWGFEVYKVIPGEETIESLDETGYERSPDYKVEDLTLDQVLEFLWWNNTEIEDPFPSWGIHIRCDNGWNFRNHKTYRGRVFDIIFDYKNDILEVYKGEVIRKTLTNEPYEPIEPSWVNKLG